MARLLQIFGFLSVLLRGASLTFQSLTVGGVIFLFFVLRNFSDDSEKIRSSCLSWLRRFALALVAIQISYLVTNSLILMESAQISLAEISGANFVLAGALGIAASLTIIVLWMGTRAGSANTLLFPAAAIVASSVLTSHAMARLEYRLSLVFVTA